MKHCDSLAILEINPNYCVNDQELEILRIVENMTGATKRTLIGALIGASTTAALGIWDHVSNQRNWETETLKKMAEFNAAVSEEMTYRQAEKQFYADLQELQVKSDQLEAVPSLDFRNVNITVDGMLQEAQINRGIVIIGSENYYSENVLDDLQKNFYTFDSRSNTVFYNSNGVKETTNTKEDLMKSGVVYDGNRCEIYDGKKEQSFNVGGQDYSVGFTVTGQTQNEGPGYALLNLEGKYTTLNVTVGRATTQHSENSYGYGFNDVHMDVYLDDVKDDEQQWDLSAQVPSTPIEINLKHANSVKIKLTTESLYGLFGFVDGVLTK